MKLREIFWMLYGGSEHWTFMEGFETSVYGQIFLVGFSNQNILTRDSQNYLNSGPMCSKIIFNLNERGCCLVLKYAPASGSLSAK